MPIMEPMFTMLPPRRFSMAWPNARVIRNTPVALTRSDSSHADTGASRLFIGRSTALLTRPSTRPNCLSTFSRKASTERSSPWSRASHVTEIPAPDLRAGDFAQPGLVARGDDKLRPGFGQRGSKLAAIQACAAGQDHHFVFQTELFEDVHKWTSD